MRTSNTTQEHTLLSAKEKQIVKFLCFVAGAPTPRDIHARHAFDKYYAWRANRGKEAV
jgi:hypothetical protein